MNAAEVYVSEQAQARHPTVVGRLTNDVVLPRPDIDIDGVQDRQEWEAPGDSVDNDMLSEGEELVDNGTKEEKMNE